MTEPKDEHYDFEADDTGESAGSDDATPAEASPATPAAPDAEHVGLEPEPEPEPTTGDEACPKCGAALPEGDAVVCMRCGFNLRTLKSADTRVGTEDVDAAAPPAPPLIRSGRGGVILPAAIALTGLVLLLIGYLAQAGGLYTGVEDTPVLQRLARFVRFVTISGLWTLSSVAALGCMAWLIGRRFGDLGLALARMAAVVVALGLVTFLNLPHQGVETSLELLIQAGLFVLAGIVLFRLSLRDAATFVGITVLVQLLLAGVSVATAWAWGWT